MKKRFTHCILLILLFVLPLSQAMAQCGGCGTGVDGAFSATVNTTLAGGVHHFTTFDIAPGVTVRVTGSQPLTIYATGTVNIQGTLDVSGLNGVDGVTFTNGGAGAVGVAGGGDGGAGSFAVSSGPIDGVAAGGAGAGGLGSGWSGGGGAGYAASGGSTGGVGGAGGPAYGNAQLAGSTAGSGGGGGSGGYNCGAGGGGAGGGFVAIISCVAIDISGTINANGGNGGSDGTGNCGGGGGGSGGSVWLTGTTVNVTGSITALGGAGGISTLVGSPYFGLGGAGAEGRVRIDGTANVTGTVSPSVGFSGAAPVQTSVNVSGSDVSCFGLADGSITASGVGTGSLQYLWSNGSTTPGLIGLAPGCYTVVMTDSLGCTDTDTLCITEPTVLDANIAGLTSNLCSGACEGIATVGATGGTPIYAALWSNGSTGFTQSNLCTGIYTATITDSHGCTDTATFVITEPTAISLTTSSVNATNGTSLDGSASVVASGGVAPYTYLWTPGGANTATATNLAAGTYVVQVTDSNGCVESDTVVVDMTIGIAPAGGMDVELFPNPTTGLLTLNLSLLEMNALTLDIFDAQGKAIRHQDLGTAQSLRTQLDLSALPAGVYHLRVTHAGGSVTKRFTLMR